MAPTEIVSIEVGDKLRMSVNLISTLQRNHAGVSMLVEVVAITEAGDGSKMLTVKSAQ